MNMKIELCAAGRLLSIDDGRIVIDRETVLKLRDAIDKVLPQMPFTMASAPPPPTPPADAESLRGTAARNIAGSLGRFTPVGESYIRAACEAHAEAHAAALAQELLDTRACYTQAFSDREQLAHERDRWKTAYADKYTEVDRLTAERDDLLKANHLYRQTTNNAVATVQRIAAERDAAVKHCQILSDGRAEVLDKVERLIAERDKAIAALRAIRPLVREALGGEQYDGPPLEDLLAQIDAALAPTQKEEKL